MKRIYLDANGSSPAIPTARAKLLEVATFFGNPSSSHEHGRMMRALVDDARLHVAAAVGAQPKEVIFTSGASEANRLFSDALMKLAEKRSRRLKILMSPYEHPSLYKPIFCEERFFCVTMLPIDEHGSLIAQQALCDDVDVLIACHAHNETGIVNNLGALIENLPPDVIVMSDISQALARMPALSDRVDVMTFSSQKMGGFAGAGGLVLRGNGKKLLPPWLGGGQERGFRPGTESVLMISACGEAARCIDASRDLFHHHQILRNYLEQRLKEWVPIKVLGEQTPRLPNTSAICFHDENPDALRIACDLAGLSVGFGAACSGLAPEGSFALKRLGLSLDEERATIRFSLPHVISKDDIDDALERLLQKVLTKKLKTPALKANT